MYPLKYIFGKSVMGAQMLVVWPAKAKEFHSDVANFFFMVCSSAGFVYLKEGKLEAFGRSESLRKETSDTDKQTLADLDLSEMHQAVLNIGDIPAMVWMKAEDEQARVEIIERSLNNYTPISSEGVGKYLSQILDHYKRSA